MTCTAVFSCRVVRLKKYSGNCHLCCDIYPPTALVPNPVGNLSSSVNPNVPSVTLTWDPPSNFGDGIQCPWSDVTKYHIRFKPKRGNCFEIHDCFTTSIVFNRDSGLTPLTTSVLEVRAQCGNCIGQWKTVSTFIGKYTIVFNIYTPFAYKSPIFSGKVLAQVFLSCA